MLEIIQNLAFPFGLFTISDFFSDLKFSLKCIIAHSSFCRIWWSGSNYSPERLSINTNDHGNQTRRALSRSAAHRNSKRQMKEKLIMRDVAADVYDDRGIEDDYGIESNYTVQSADGRELAQSIRTHTSYQEGTSMELDKVPVINLWILSCSIYWSNVVEFSVIHIIMMSQQDLSLQALAVIWYFYLICKTRL